VGWERCGRASHFLPYLIDKSYAEVLSCYCHMISFSRVSFESNINLALLCHRVSTFTGQASAMDAFISRKRTRLSDQNDDLKQTLTLKARNDTSEDEDSTDFKLALLASLHPGHDDETLLEALLISEGSVGKASDALDCNSTISPRKKLATWKNGVGYQSSLSSFNIKRDRVGDSNAKGKKPLTKKGRTLYLYSPEDIEKHTPCSIIHNFLRPEEADALLLELLKETPTFHRETFKLFDKVVQSPHSMGFYVDTLDEAETQKTDYVYNGSYIEVL